MEVGVPGSPTGGVMGGVGLMEGSIKRLTHGMPANHRTTLLALVDGSLRSLHWVAMRWPYPGLRGRRVAGTVAQPGLRPPGQRQRRGSRGRGSHRRGSRRWGIVAVPVSPPSRPALQGGRQPRQQPLVVGARAHRALGRAVARGLGWSRAVRGVGPQREGDGCRSHVTS